MTAWPDDDDDDDDYFDYDYYDDLADWEIDLLADEPIPFLPVEIEPPIEWLALEDLKQAAFERTFTHD